jgi:2-amino-4-hydroxy-6-hydroxymethyldihydropteridine diphosphokinase
MAVVRAYIGLGANVGDARATLTAAVHALAALPGARLAGVSRLYVTAPVEVTDQPEFHNAVVALDVPAGRSGTATGGAGTGEESAAASGSGAGVGPAAGSAAAPEIESALPRPTGLAAAPPAATGPIALLLALKSIERAFGRRERYRYGPRELDLDLLLFGEERVLVERPEAGRSPDPAKVERLLEIPHPEAGRRLFVLAPLADLAPDLVPPGWTQSVEQARARRESIEGASAARAVAIWDAAVGAWVEPA